MDLNTVALCGRLGRDVEVKFFGDGKAVAKFTIAVNGFKRGEDQETHWIDCEAWGKTAEFMGQRLAKGCRVNVCGSLKVERWEDKDGNKRSKVLVTARDVQPIDWADDRKGMPAGEARPPAAPSAVNSDDEPPF
jgi:single-strand DNA-binding protein